YNGARARLFLGPTRLYLAALRQRNAIRDIWRRYFTEFDAFLLPTAFVQAVEHNANIKRTIATPTGERRYDDLLFWIAAATLTGHPATVAPVGLADGLPVGIQVMGPELEDATSIDIAGFIAD